jgi:yecA family protein
MPDFDRVQTALEQLDANVDAAEAHGTLSALLIDNAGFATWLGHTLDELPDKGNVLAAEQLGVLEQLFEQTRGQLDDEDLSLELLLPDETDDFDLRLLGLSQWCQGFLYGFGVSGAAVEDSLDDESRECLSDLLEISKLGHDEETSDESEQQYVEIVEHVRVATLLLNESLNPLKTSSSVE